MKRMIIAMTLILALVLGAVALAETTEPEAPAGQSGQAVPEEGAATEDGTEPKDENADAAAAPEDAFKALRDARLSTKLEELQTELDEYVAAGKLTQEQAGLIVNSIKEQQEARQSKGRCDYQQMPGNQKGGNQQFGQFPGRR